jgi:hypothetical protein
MQANFMDILTVVFTAFAVVGLVGILFFDFLKGF